jgi:hypothetical protein
VIIQIIAGIITLFSIELMSQEHPRLAIVYTLTVGIVVLVSVLKGC